MYGTIRNDDQMLLLNSTCDISRCLYLFVICFAMHLKVVLFKSCFQQCAKGKMTALTARSYQNFVKLCLLACGLHSTLRCCIMEILCVLC